MMVITGEAAFLAYERESRKSERICSNCTAVLRAWPSPALLTTMKFGLRTSTHLPVGPARAEANRKSVPSAAAMIDLGMRSPPNRIVSCRDWPGFYRRFDYPLVNI